MSITLDTTHRPLFIVTLKVKASDAEIRENLAEWTAHFFEPQTPYSLVYDAREATAFSPIQRQLTADWVTMHAGQIRRWCVGCSFGVRHSYPKRSNDSGSLDFPATLSFSRHGHPQ